MSAFEPRRAAPRAVRRWLREAGALLLRRPLAWSGCGLAIAVVPILVARAIEAGALPRVPGTLAAVLCVDAWLILACALGVHVAALADESEGAGALGARLTDAARALAVPLRLSLLSWGVIYAALVAWGAGAWPGLLEMLRGAEAAPGQRAAVLLGALNVALAPVGGWFALPLLAHAGVELGEALRLSMRGSVLNARVLWPLALGCTAVWAPVSWAAVTRMPPVGLGAAMGLVLPPLSALLYVSYREVFLGRGLNAPAKATVRGGAGAASAPVARRVSIDRR